MSARFLLLDSLGYHSILFLCHLVNYLWRLSESQDCNWYSWREAEHLFDALNVTFYDQFEFRGNSSNYYKPSNSYIDKVLATKHGIPITLCLLYASVAKLLGLYCKPGMTSPHLHCKQNYFHDFRLFWKCSKYLSQGQSNPNQKFESLR